MRSSRPLTAPTQEMRLRASSGSDRSENRAWRLCPSSSHGHREGEPVGLGLFRVFRCGSVQEAGLPYQYCEFLAVVRR
jgi:hypothetical protein